MGGQQEGRRGDITMAAQHVRLSPKTVNVQRGMAKVPPPQSHPNIFRKRRKIFTFAPENVTKVPKSHLIYEFSDLRRGFPDLICGGSPRGRRSLKRVYIKRGMVQAPKISLFSSVKKVSNLRIIGSGEGNSRFDRRGQKI